MQYINIQAQRQPAAHQEKRRIRHEEIELARGYAQRGHSFSFTAELLGMTNKRLRKLLEDERADIQFVHGMRSLATQRRLEELHNSQRGKKASPAILAALAHAREKRCTRYTAFGVTGLLRELKDHFGCKLAMQSLRDRIKSGMSVEEALTKAAHRAPRGVYPPQFYDWLIKRRTMAAADIMVIARNRLTPTMLQYVSPEHNIKVTAQDAAHITVEVRNQKEDVLHRMRFIKSFESGVLFVFNPLLQGHIQFIAFEPNSQALVLDSRPGPAVRQIPMKTYRELAIHNDAPHTHRHPDHRPGLQARIPRRA